jgi:hypothetical protein
MSEEQSIVGNASAKLSWDPSAGKQNKRPFLLLPFSPLNSRHRITWAADHAVGAAVLIALAHFWTAAFVADGLAPGDTLIGSDPRLLVGVQVTAGLLALYLAARTRRRPSRPCAWLLMAWALMEAVPWVPLALYGHAIFAGRFGGVYAVAVLYYAALGVRGAHALKRLGSYPKSPEGPLQLRA